MRIDSLFLLLFAGVLLVGCNRNDPNLTFQVYEMNPLRESFVKNQVTSYVKYFYQNGRLEKRDTVCVDRKGNVISEQGMGYEVSESFFEYDSLGRITRDSFNSDLGGTDRFSYELKPNESTVIRHTKYANKITHTDYVRYDRTLSKILKEVSVSYYSMGMDSMVTIYGYDGDKLINKTRWHDPGRSDIADTTEFIYERDKLVRISRRYGQYTRLGQHVQEDDYLSNQTGLVDSTVVWKIDYKTVFYYKYYFAENAQQ